MGHSEAGQLARGSRKALEEEMTLGLGYGGWVGLWGGRKEQSKPKAMGPKAWAMCAWNMRSLSIDY